MQTWCPRVRRTRVPESAQPSESFLTPITSRNFQCIRIFSRKVVSQARWKVSASPFCSRIFAGTGRLTASIKHLGLRDSLGIDHKISDHLAAPGLQLYFLKQETLEFIEQIIQEQTCVYVHFALPCGTTASRARFIRRKGRYNLPVLRTDSHRNGPPNLRSVNAAKVAAAKRLYDIAQRLLENVPKTGRLVHHRKPGT